MKYNENINKGGTMEGIIHTCAQSLRRYSKDLAAANQEASPAKEITIAILIESMGQLADAWDEIANERALEEQDLLYKEKTENVL